VAEDITHIKDLIPDPKNRRAHTPRNVGMIVDALHAVGAARSIVIDEAGTVLAGNATIEAAAEAGITRVRKVVADGNEVIAVQRLGLTPDQKRDLALYDNRTAELASWDVAQLAADLDEGVDLSGQFTEEELAAVLASVETETPAVVSEVTPAVRATTIERGQVFALGQHRLMCGDSTSAEDVARLMDGAVADLVHADPPYGMGKEKEGIAKQLKKRRRRTDGLVVANDSLKPEEFGAFLTEAIGAWPLIPGGSFYVCASGGDRQVVPVLEKLHEVRQMIVWVKDRMVLSRQDYHWRHENIWYGWKAGKAHYFLNDRTQTTVWEFERPATSPEHPTMKPTELIMRAIGNSSVRGQIVFDGFLGSGSTLVASEEMHRKCYGLELEPSYCQVVIDRWEAQTGQQAEKLP